VLIEVAGGNVDRFIKAAAELTVQNLSVKHQTLEDIFIDFYGKEVK